MFDDPLWGLFFSAFLPSALLPGGSEAVLAYLTRAQGDRLGLLLAVVSVGNILGDDLLAVWQNHCDPLSG